MALLDSSQPAARSIPHPVIGLPEMLRPMSALRWRPCHHNVEPLLRSRLHDERCHMRVSDQRAARFPSPPTVLPARPLQRALPKEALVSGGRAGISIHLRRRRGRPRHLPGRFSQRDSLGPGCRSMLLHLDREHPNYIANDAILSHVANYEREARYRPLGGPCRHRSYPCSRCLLRLSSSGIRMRECRRRHPGIPAPSNRRFNCTYRCFDSVNHFRDIEEIQSLPSPESRMPPRMQSIMLALVCGLYALGNCVAPWFVANYASQRQADSPRSASWFSYRVELSSWLGVTCFSIAMICWLYESKMMGDTIGGPALPVSEDHSSVGQWAPWVGIAQVLIATILISYSKRGADIPPASPVRTSYATAQTQTHEGPVSHGCANAYAGLVAESSSRRSPNEDDLEQGPSSADHETSTGSPNTVVWR